MAEYKEVKWGEETDKSYEVTVAPDGSIYYTLDGEFHRTDGPAVIDDDGYKAWYLNGKLHREDGPAIIDDDGYKEWYLNDKRHREDGPAVIWADGIKEWYLNGKEIYKKDFTIEMIKRMNASELFTPAELAKLRLDESS